MRKWKSLHAKFRRSTSYTTGSELHIISSRKKIGSVRMRLGLNRISQDTIIVGEVHRSADDRITPPMKARTRTAMTRRNVDSARRWIGYEAALGLWSCRIGDSAS